MILFKLEERNMKLEDLDRILEKPVGYSAYVICDSSITTFPSEDAEKLTEYFALSESEKLILKSVDDRTLTDEYIINLLDFISEDEEIKHTVIGCDRKLQVLNHSRSLPGEIRDVMLEPVENYSCNFFPITERRGDYIVGGPTYTIHLENGFNVYFAKAFRKVDIDDEHSEYYMRHLNVMCIADSNDHMIDFIETSISYFNYMKKESELYYRIQSVYEWFQELFGDETYYIAE